MEQLITQLFGGAGSGGAVKDSDMGHAGNAIAGATAASARCWAPRLAGVAGLVVQVIVGTVLTRMRAEPDHSSAT